jgi:hypothetical protein
MDTTTQPSTTHRVLWMLVLPKHVVDVASAYAQATQSTRNAVVEAALCEYVRGREDER